MRNGITSRARIQEFRNYTVDKMIFHSIKKKGAYITYLCFLKENMLPYLYLHQYLLMKRIFYLFLMMLFFVIASGMIYLSALVVVVRNHLIPLHNLIAVTDILMSPEVYFLVGAIWAICGYFFGKRWWQIIYVDGVYYFDKTKKRDSRRRVIKKTPTEG